LSKKLYVGNLPFSSTEPELRELFERHGSVESVNVITDRETGRPRGFAFVEMSEASAASDAIKALDGTQLGGRALTGARSAPGRSLSRRSARPSRCARRSSTPR
jgi:RNA recognition motif-containing protein